MEILELNAYTDHIITVRSLGDGTLEDEYYRALKSAEQNNDKNFLILSNTESLLEIFEHAQQVGLMTRHQEFIVSSLDFHALNLKKYTHSGVKIKGFRMIDPKNERVQKITETFKSLHGNKTFPESLKAENLRVDIALAVDSCKSMEFL